MIQTTMKRQILLILIGSALVGCLDEAPTDGSNNVNSANNTTTNNANGAPNATTNGDPNNGGNVVTRPQVESVAIDPPSAVLTATDGASVEQEFQLVVTYADGSTSATEPVEWSADNAQIGRIGERDGVYNAFGIAGGESTITATLLDERAFSATATVRVIAERELVAAGAPANIKDVFNGAPVTDAAREALLVYPLEGAVMPQNVFPADLQWERGVEGDYFRITLAKGNATVTAYLAHTGAGFGNHWLVDQDAWRSMAQTDAVEPFTITVDRWEASTGQVIAGAPVSMRFADAALSGSVYYWDIAAGRIVRINDGEGAREEFMPTPPPSPDGNQCVGCHAVSNDGRYMVGRLGGGFNAGAVFDLTEDLTQQNPPTEFAVSNTSPYWNFATWSPDNSRLVATGNEWAQQGMKLVDPFAGQEVPVQSGQLPGNGTTHPAWSPDGSLLAYVENAGTFGGANTTGDIAVMEVTGQDSFGQSTIIQPGNAVPNAVPAGAAASYPTWTPDSEWLAFAHGTGSRSEDQQSALYMIKPDGTGLVRLDNASGGAATDTFLPNFSPFDQGGYFWVSYLSRRDYGNAEAGTKGSNLQQIWVSAVKANPVAGEDPSEVGYWLPGQNTESRNISAYWAPRACRNDGESCSVGSECCSGECLPNSDGDLVCSPPPPERCREIGESCNQTSDCCEPSGSVNVVCTQNACTRIVN